MTSMRVNRRLEELSGFHLGLLQYFLQKGWKRVQNGSIFPQKCIENRGLYTTPTNSKRSHRDAQR
ncbi:Hypothetical predicted protein [Scomber scombrus]|uniref:Uncharacterized protein n=1 Tax=Scomber scombrus TaxID=13677 RepID=A0AAV1PCH2_SCOSC